MNVRNVGGTRGGLGLFVIGLAMAIAGGYLLLNQVTVHGGYWHFGGYSGNLSFGLTLLPLLVGIGFLFFNVKSVVGWVLTGGGAVIILVGIIVNMEIYFRSTSVYNTLAMLVLLFGGLGLLARALFPVGRGEAEGAG